jgi:hypothetical protein
VKHNEPGHVLAPGDLDEGISHEGKGTTSGESSAGALKGTRIMPQWEYEKIDLNDLPRRRSDIDILNDAGHDGWEIVTITANAVAYLKRRIEAAQKPPKTKAPKP